VNPDPAQTSSATSAKAEPTALRRAVPVWLFPITLVMIFWGMWYFDSQGGWFDPHVYTPYTDHKELEVWQPVATADPEAMGRIIYNKPTCVTCHQADGNGTPGQFPPLTSSEWLKEKEPGRVIRIVLNGLNGPLEMNGKSFNGSMVPWGGEGGLNDDEIAAVLTYVRGKAFGNNAPPVDPKRVKAVHDKLKAAGRTQPFTPDELKSVSPAD
jgi:mono/diheme cytochrome c family protein